MGQDGLKFQTHVARERVAHLDERLQLRIVIEGGSRRGHRIEVIHRLEIAGFIICVAGDPHGRGPVFVQASIQAEGVGLDQSSRNGLVGRQTERIVSPSRVLELAIAQVDHAPGGVESQLHGAQFRVDDGPLAILQVVLVFGAVEHAIGFVVKVLKTQCSLRN